ncbi:MAG TPA: IPT/TIG domain-containing protein [Bryobacteraceae bacterium]|nr:IPT/TIG domain-containing protein [Bryobacteraceae bacterium]
MMHWKHCLNRMIASPVPNAIAAAALAAFLSLPRPAGAALALSPDGLTVYDSANNITWLADFNLPASSQFGLPVCGASAAQPCVNPNGSMRYQSAVAWVAAMNAAQYLGHADWQLPTTPSIDHNCGRTGPNGDSFGFGCTAGALDTVYNAAGLKSPNTAVPIPNNTVGPFSNFQPYLYWSQSGMGGQGNATFSFATGFQGANTLPNFLYLLPMIPGKLPGTPPAIGNGLQVNPGGQTVYDPATNITWLANANLAASNAFGLPACKGPLTPALCVEPDGAMTWASAVQFLDNMNHYNGAGYLGQNNWQAPSIDPTCPNYNCAGTSNPMGNLFYAQLGFIQGTSIVPVPDIPVGPFHDMQPYLYWTCGAGLIQDPCQSDGPAPNFEWSYSFGSGFQGTDLLANSLFVTAYFVGSRGSTTSSSPALTGASVANGATYVAGGLVPGSWAQVKGTNLANVTHQLAAADLSGSNLPLEMSGASVAVNGQPAPLYFISPTQIDFQVPAGVSGTASVEVFNNGAASNVVTGATAASAPGIWPIIVNGTNYAAAVFLDGKFAGDPGVNAAVFRNARPGDQIQLFGTGLAASPAGVEIPSFQPLSGVTVTLGPVTVPAEAAGLLAPGEFQINFAVPAAFSGMPAGNYPLTVAINGVSSPATIDSVPPGPLLIPVQP